ncbi:M48 family peptidase [bacterium]|nr:M48 family peptidase [bacterium]
MKVTETAQTAIDKVLEAMKNGDLVKVMSYAMIQGEDCPSANWSLANRALMFLSGTADARGFKQWNKVKRQVQAGSKAIYIIAPNLREITVEKDEETGEETKKRILLGFRAIPVYKIENTEGEPLPSYEPNHPPRLLEVAKEFGLSVDWVPGGNSYYGYFCNGRNEIKLATHEEIVFWHELSHAAHYKLGLTNEYDDKVKKELVAELSAATLCYLYTGKVYEFSKKYIESYAGQDAGRAALRVLSDVEKVLTLILETAGERALPSSVVQLETDTEPQQGATLPLFDSEAA